MKSIALSFLLLSCLCCFADDTNIIAMSDWSEPVGFDHHSIRGRLLIVAGSEPNYGGPKTDNATMMFVELQYAPGACCGSVKVYFDGMGLKCDLTDSNGKPGSKPKFGGGGRGGRGPLIPSWVVVPYNSTIRLFVNSGSKSPLTISQSGEPWSYWSIPSSDTNVYYLSASLTISTPTNATLTATPHESPNIHEYAAWNGKLIFPKMKISANKQ
jgi:hypothetical protein